MTRERRNERASGPSNGPGPAHGQAFFAWFPWWDTSPMVYYNLTSRRIRPPRNAHRCCLSHSIQNQKGKGLGAGGWGLGAGLGAGSREWGRLYGKLKNRAHKNYPLGLACACTYQVARFRSYAAGEKLFFDNSVCDAQAKVRLRSRGGQSQLPRHRRNGVYSGSVAVPRPGKPYQFPTLGTWPVGTCMNGPVLCRILALLPS